jgi:LPS O-antigen subunit length determinant protein (WzzB/FepE family)
MLNTALNSLRFTASYLIPSLYPAMIATLGFVIAIFETPAKGTIEPWLLNAFAWIGVITLIATLALTLKKLFGRQPSLSEILSGLVTVKTLDGYKEEQRLRTLGLETQISAARHAFDARANSDLVRTQETFREIFGQIDQSDRMVGELSKDVSRLQERTETHLRKLDQYDTKLDNLLREVSRAAAAGVRSAQE